MNHFFTLSRPRFWLYVAGPFVLGALSGSADISRLLTWPLIISALYFTLPANLLIYGVNDIFDYETDKHNAKKRGYEALLHPDQRGKVWSLMALTTLPWLGYIFLTSSLTTFAAALAFIFFGVFYSVPPIRAKAIPVVDSFFNILYVFPGIVGYLLAGGNQVNLPLIAAATAWCMAMHAFSAIPDITSDTKAKVKTVATLLGTRSTLAFCTVLYATSAVLAYPTLKSESVILGGCYVLLMLAAWYVSNPSLKHKKGETVEQRMFSLYTRFPLLNTLAGMSLFFWLLGERF